MAEWTVDDTRALLKRGTIPPFRFQGALIQKQVVLDLTENQGAVAPIPNALPSDTTVSLPDDVPARDMLIAAGVTTVDALRAVDDLTSIMGIGKVTASHIYGWLVEYDGRGE